MQFIRACGNGRWLPLACVLILFTQPVLASKRVGLVLAGGGARGLAHVGVIRALEELQVPVHAVTGTSIGALVGGFYASGLDSHRLDRIVDDMDWSQSFEDIESRSRRPQRRKADDYDAPGNFRFQFTERGLATPLGILHGQQSRQTLPRACRS